MINFFTKEEGSDIVAAIRAAEMNTSGEIRVHLEKNFDGSLMEAALRTFKKLKMHRTRLRNGVLFFIVPDRRGFVVLGDEGINKIVPEGYWNDVRDILQEYFREGHYAQGLIEGIMRVGEKLKAHFPREQDDKNELSDDISYGSE